MTKISGEVPESLQNYLLMWNEPNPENIRRHLNRAVSEDCLWIDPQHSHIGRDALEENVRGFRQKFAGAELALASNVDGHNNRYRYYWTISVASEVVFSGFDVVTLNDNGEIERVDGFFGELERLK